MTKQEFDKLTAREWGDSSIFEKANRVYMQAGDIDKKTFCDEFMKFPAFFMDGGIVMALTKRAEEQEISIGLQQNIIEKLKVTLLQAALDADTEETWEKVKEVLGPVEVIRYKLDNQLELTAADRSYIIGHLKNDEL